MKILNFGSLNIDYVYSVDHFVRAGETISSHAMEVFCGGKGLNQSVAFARAGADVYHAGCIGAEGAMLVDMLKDSGVDTDLVRTVAGTACGHAIIQVSPGGENCILLYGGANQAITAEQIDQTLACFCDGDLLILRVCANGFLYNMARAMAGTVVYAAEGKIKPAQIGQILDSGNRTAAGPTVPPGGLYMSHLWYDDGVEFFECTPDRPIV